jgi:hypothetical protein
MRARVTAYATDGYWLGRQDSNLGLAESKPAVQADVSTTIPTLLAMFPAWRTNGLQRESE